MSSCFLLLYAVDLESFPLATGGDVVPTLMLMRMPSFMSFGEDSSICITIF